MKIAVIGSGISGLACAHYLSDEHEVWVYEAAGKIGGHTATVDVTLGTRQYAIDTGFIVFNDWTYPHFIALLDECEFARYAPASNKNAQMDAVLEKAKNIIF